MRTCSGRHRNPVPLRALLRRGAGLPAHRFLERSWTVRPAGHCGAEDGGYAPWYNGTEKHTLGEKHAADYTKCGGGYKEEYYECSVCEYACTAEGNDAIWSPAVSNKHNVAWIAEIPATTTKTGLKAHWGCVDCSTIFIDEAGTEMMWLDEDYDALVIPKLKPGNPAVPATADNSMMGLYMVLALASASAIALVSTKAKRV